MSSYTNIFGGGVIQPSDVSYLSISLSINTELSWPTQFQDTNQVVANIIDVTPTAGGYVLYMPDATLVSVGTAFLMNNPSAYDFHLLDYDGNLLCDFTTGSLNYFYLIDNSTQAGSWRQSLWGEGVTAVTSVGANVPTTPSSANMTISGSPITTAGTIGFTFAGDLLKLISFGTSVGIAARTSNTPPTWAIRTITGTANQIAVTNGGGVAGNPTLALATTITGITSLTSGNILIAANTISSTNGNGDINLTTNGTGEVRAILPLSMRTAAPIKFWNATNTFYMSFAGGNTTGNINLIWPTTSPVVGQILSAQTTTQLTWATVATFSGTSTTTAIARYSNTTGSLENSGVLIDNTNNITGATSLVAGEFQIGVADPNTISTIAGNINLTPNGISEVVCNSTLVISSTNNLKFNNPDGLFTTSLYTEDSIAAVSYRLPIAVGADTSLMQTNAAGKLSFSALTATIATKSDMQTHTSTTHPVIPANTQYHPGVAKAWVVFTVAATVVTVQDSYNVTSVVRVSAGIFTITFTTAFATAYYSINVSTVRGAVLLIGGAITSTPAPSTTAFRAGYYEFNTGVETDPEIGFIAVHGTQ